MLICDIIIENTRQRDYPASAELADCIVLMVNAGTVWLYEFVEMLDPYSSDLATVAGGLERTLSAVKRADDCRVSTKFFTLLKGQLNEIRARKDGEARWPEFLGNLSEVAFYKLMSQKYLQNAREPVLHREGYPRISRKAFPEEAIECKKPIDVLYWNVDRGTGEFVEVKKTLKTLRNSSRARRKFGELAAFQDELDARFSGHSIRTTIATFSDAFEPHTIINMSLGRNPREALPLTIVSFEHIGAWLQAA